MDTQHLSEEEQEEELPRTMKRSAARTLIDLVDDEDHPTIVSTAAGKAPASSSLNLYNLEDDVANDDAILASGGVDVYDEEPDLEGYFGQFNLSNWQQIAICRTYANYMAQIERSKVHEGLGNVKRIRVRKINKSV